MISATIKNLVQDLKPRQQEVLAGRFGLTDGEKKTLASLGEQYGITRERVRQIEVEAIRSAQDRINKEKGLVPKILDSIAGHLKNFGGLRRDDLLLNELKVILEDKNLHHWHLRFLSEIVNQPYYYPTDEDFYDFWYLDKKNIPLVSRFISKLENLIAGKKEDLIIHRKFNNYFIKVINTYNIPGSVGMNYISLSRRFNINPFGDLGLSHWEEINPKTMRSKAYLVLKKNAKPMHFREISEAINKIGLGSRLAHPQTVHNELIKDPRFVLVGRGIYGLSEHGFIPGTTREVITKILKEKGPLSSREIIDSVLKKKFLKENTILLNLQNKKHFKRSVDGKYRLVKS